MVSPDSRPPSPSVGKPPQNPGQETIVVRTKWVESGRELERGPGRVSGGEVYLCVVHTSVRTTGAGPRVVGGPFPREVVGMGSPSDFLYLGE